MRGKVTALLAVLLLLAGCAAAPESASSSLPTPEEVLCQELKQRGIADYDSKALEPYDGSINGCISYTDWGREWDMGELLVYKIVTGYNQYQGESGPVTIADYDVAAVTKDLQYFFAMSHVDGALYDIRDNAAYIHDGEHTREEARRELERYLRAETDINPDDYDITVWAQWIDEAYNYQAALDEKGAAPGADHAHEFYLSKDLKRIARIDYRQEPGERKEHLGGRFWTGSAKARCPRRRRGIFSSSRTAPKGRSTGTRCPFTATGCRWRGAAPICLTSLPTCLMPTGFWRRRRRSCIRRRIIPM